MNEKLRALVAQIQQRFGEAEALLAKGEGLTQEDILKVQALNAECSDLRKQAETLKTASEQAGELRQWLSTPVMPAPHANGAAVEGIAKAGVTEVDRKSKSVLYQDGEALISDKQLAAISSNSYRDAFRRYLRTGREMLGATDLRTLQEGADTAGGYLVPEEILTRLIAKEPTPTRIAGRVMTLNTSRDRLVIPKVNYSTDDLYTTGMRVTWSGEIPASATTHRVTEPVFGTVGIEVFTAMMSLPLTNDLVEDSVFPLQAWVSEKFRETIDLLLDNMILNGTGVAQPAGILQNPNGTNEPAQVVSGSGAALTADGLIDLAYALPEQYDDSSVFIFNKTSTEKAIAKLKDSENRYLFATGVQDSGLASARPTSLLGYPLVRSGFMPNVAANAFPIIFGDPRGYYLVRRIGFSVQVLRELYAETNQILVLGRTRFGGDVAEDWRMKIQKVSA